MSIKRGVVTEGTSTSARPISVTSTFPIALVLKSSLVPTGIYGFESPKKGLEYFKQYLFKKQQSFLSIQVALLFCIFRPICEETVSS